MKKKMCWVEDMTKALDTFPEALSSVPSTMLGSLQLPATPTPEDSVPSWKLYTNKNKSEKIFSASLLATVFCFILIRIMSRQGDSSSADSPQPRVLRPEGSSGGPRAYCSQF